MSANSCELIKILWDFCKVVFTLFGQDIIIKPADKSSETVVMDRTCT